METDGELMEQLFQETTVGAGRSPEGLGAYDQRRHRRRHQRNLTPEEENVE